MHLPFILILPLLLLTLASAAWAQSTPEPCDNCGRVQTIQAIEDRQEWTPLGAGASSGFTASGSETGAATMMQFAPRAQDRGAMVVVGAAGGATYAQRPNQYRRQRWEVTVVMDKGPPRVLTLAYEPLVRVDDRVRVSGNQLELFNP
jgi:hypothetical protein